MSETTAPHRDRPAISVVVPIRREQPNLRALVERVERVREAHRLELELILVDDESGDGTAETVASLARSWVRLVQRRGEPGLSQAVLAGFALARHDVLVVMDGDLSHPPEAIPMLVDRVMDGADFVLGSRYAPGGSTEEGWGFLRWLNSVVATWLAWPLVRVSDPMAGFFALPRRTLEGAAPLHPTGYKIGLELLVKGGCRRVDEVPIHFARRREGRSKLDARARLLYLRHLMRLYAYRHPLLRRAIPVLALLAGAALLAALLAGGSP